MAKRHSMLYNAMHCFSGFCEECSHQLETCPMCRCEIVTRIPDTNDNTDNRASDTIAASTSDNQESVNVNNLKVCKVISHKTSTESLQQTDVSA